MYSTTRCKAATCEQFFQALVLCLTARKGMVINMKSLADLEAIRQEIAPNVNMRKYSHAIRITVGMGTCGIAAGARNVMTAFTEEITKRNLEHVAVTLMDCIGKCDLEPIVEVQLPDEEKVTYVNMDPQKACRVIEEHIINKRPVKEYMINE